MDEGVGMAPPQPDRKKSLGSDTEEGNENEKAPSVEDFGGSSLPEGRNGVILNGWRIESRKASILTGPEVEKWQKELNAFSLPEMVFGESCLELEHLSSGTRISFNAFDALKEWKAANLPPVKVPAAAAWMKREKPQQEAILDYDYTFTTPYQGTLSSPETITGQAVGLAQHKDNSTNEKKAPEQHQSVSQHWERSDAAEIDWELLKRRDPILYSDEIVLYEDELADSGTALLTSRVRVMPHSWFVLLRFWLRVDGVLMRAYETRLFCHFPFSINTSAPNTSGEKGAEHHVVIREHLKREDTFESLARKGFPREVSFYQLPDTAVQRLSVCLHEKSVLHLE